MFRFFNKFAVVGLASVALSTVAAAADIRTFAFAYQGQFTPDDEVVSQLLNGSTSNFASTGTVEASLDESYAFRQTYDDGSESVAFWLATSTAKGGSGVLKAGVTSEFQSFLSFADNGALPNFLMVQAQTSFSDSFDVGGNAAFVAFSFQIDGDSAVEGPGTSSGLVLFGDLDQAYFAAPGATDTSLVTKLLPVVNGRVDLSLILDASVTHDLRSMAPGDYLYGAGFVNYLNTLKLTKVTGFSDATGTQEVAINSLTGTDGFDYAQVLSGITPSAAPEPASWAMMVAGFGAVGFALRSRRKPLVTFA